MSDAASQDFEALLKQAFAPVEPPASLSQELETRLTKLNEAAWDELESWELQALSDPRNWARVARPAAAAVIGAGAGTALVLLRKQRRARRETVPRALGAAHRLLRR